MLWGRSPPNSQALCCSFIISQLFPERSSRSDWVSVIPILLLDHYQSSGSPCPVKILKKGWAWFCFRLPLVPIFRRQRQADLCEPEASPIYIVTSRPAGTTQRPCLKNSDTKNKTLLNINFFPYSATSHIVNYVQDWFLCSVTKLVAKPGCPLHEPAFERCVWQSLGECPVILSKDPGGQCWRLLCLHLSLSHLSPSAEVPEHFM